MMVDTISFSQTAGKLLKVFLPFGLYIFLNEIFFHIALVISERRIVAFPWITVYACGDPVGFDPKKVVLFTIFLLSRLLFIYLASRVLVRKYEFQNIAYWTGTYTIMDFLLVVLSLLFSSVLWEVYFSSANPILALKKMWANPSWFYFLGTGLVCLLFYQVCFRQQPRDYLKIFVNDAVSFGLGFGLYYLYFGRIILI